MKSLLLPFLLLGSFARAQGPAPRVSISPDKPAAGDRVTVTYRADKAPAGFTITHGMMLEVLVVDRGGYPEGVLREFLMKRSGQRWTTSFSVDHAPTRLLLFRFVADGKVDDDGDNVWATMVYDRGGRPVVGAHYALSCLYRYGICSFKRKQDARKMSEELTLERALYPENWDAVNAGWDALLAKGSTDSLRSAIRSELDSFVEKSRNNDSLLAQYPRWYERIGDSTKAREIRAYGISRVPDGFVAYEANMSEFGTVRDPVEKVKLLQRSLAGLGPASPQSARDAVRSQIVYYGIQAKQFDAAIEALNGASKPSWSLYSRLALALSKTGGRFAEAGRLARRGAELATIADPESRKYYKTRQEWEEAFRDSKASSLRTLGDILAKDGNIQAALTALRDAYDASKGEDADIDLEYVEALALDKQFERAVSIGFEIVKKGKSTDSLISDMRQYYTVAVGGPSFETLPEIKQKAFEERFSHARKEMSAAIRARVLKNRMSLQSVDFTLKTTDGKPVRLSSLGGKVVVIDFWATWCGPCRLSFPFLQKVFDKYRDNPRVAIYAIDCWENKKDFAEAADNARKFLDANGYTWPALVDDRDEVVALYGVEGIPTKFILDSGGKIAFKSVGYDGPDMDEEMTQQIEVLLADSKK